MKVLRPFAEDKEFHVLSFQKSVSATQNNTAGWKGKKRSTNNPQSAKILPSYIIFIILPGIPLLFL